MNSKCHCVPLRRRLGMQRSRPKSDYAGQNLPSHPQRDRNNPVSRSEGKNSFSEQTTAKFVRPAPRTVGFAARRANRFGETARAIHGTTLERSAWLSNMHSLLGTVRELRTADFKQVQPWLSAASSSQRAGLNSSKPHRTYHKKRIRANSVHPHSPNFSHPPFCPVFDRCQQAARQIDC